MPSPPVTVTLSPSRSTVAPNSGSRSSRSSPTCVVSAGQPGIVTLPPVTSAAARNGAALERSGSMATSAAAIVPGRDDPVPGLGLPHARRRAARAWRWSSRCAAGSAGARRRGAGRGRRSKRAAASSRPETNWLVRVASIVIAPPATRPVPCTVNGSAARASSLMSTPRSRSDDDRRGHRAGGGRPRRRRRSSGRARDRRPAAGSA